MRRPHRARRGISVACERDRAVLAEATLARRHPCYCADVTEDELSRCVARCLQEGRAQWPDVATDDDALAPLLAEQLAAADIAPERYPDVFVSTAARAGDPAASTSIFQRVRALAPIATRGVIPPGDLDELVQQVCVKLLVAGNLPGRIASYAGRGPLDAWLRAVVVRAALSMRRGRAEPAASSIDELPWLELPLFADDPSLAGWRRYAPELRAALATAIAELPTRSRVALHQHFLDGLSADAIGRIYGVHRITAYRWIAQAKRAVLDRVRAELLNKIEGSPSEVESLLRGVRSSFSITVERLFAASES